MYSGDKRRDFKKGLDQNDQRRRRQEKTMSLRKKQREELMNKRRQGVDNQTFVGPENQGERSALLQQEILKIPQYAQMVVQPNAELQLQGINSLRKLLCAQGNPPINEVVASGIVPRIVQLVANSNDAKFQKEGAWTLTNICSGTSEHTRLVASHNAIPMFVNLLSSPHAMVREQAVWALGNIAGDCPETRNACIGANILPPLRAILAHQQSHLKVKQTAAWVVRNCIRGKPSPPLNALGQFVPVLQELLNCGDPQIQYDATWGCVYFTQNVKHITAFLSTALVDQIVGLIKSQNPKCAIPALRVIGNVTCGTKLETEAIVKRGVMPMLRPYISNKERGVRKWCCWALSNVTAGSPEQITAVFQAGLLGHVLKSLRQDEFDVKKEAAWVIANAMNGNDQHKEFLHAQGATHALCGMLGCNVPRTLECVMQGLKKMLRWGKNVALLGGPNKVAHVIQECGGQDKIEALFNSEMVRRSKKLFDKTQQIVDEFFSEQSGPAVQGLAPAQTAAGTFAFGAPTAGGNGLLTF